MAKLLRITGKQLIKALKSFGFEVVRIKGSHHILRNSEGKVTVNPEQTKEKNGSGK